MMKFNSIIITVLILVIFQSCGGNDSSNSDNSTGNTDTATVTIKDTMTIPATVDSTISAKEQADKADQSTQEMIRAYLREKYKTDLSKNLIEEASRKFIFHRIDLNGDGEKEVFVGFTGPYFCGSGGCSILLLDSKGEKLTQFSVTDYPVHIAASSTKGWKDLLLSSAGKYHDVKFNGKSYPSNPSVLPVVAKSAETGLTVLDFTKESYPWHSF